MKIGLNNRFGGILLLYIVFIIVSFISRTVLLGMSFHDINLGILGLLWAYGVDVFAEGLTKPADVDNLVGSFGDE